VRAVELEAALAVLTIVYRAAAKARWKTLDWMVCRAGSEARGARRGRRAASGSV
jgi:hypothetical protein